MSRAEDTEPGGEGGRERLLRAAGHLFAEKGYAATTVRDLLRAASVTAPVLYYHFGNKEGLWVALVREVMATFDEALERSLATAGTAAERIRCYCRAALEVRRAYPSLNRVLWEILAGPPGAAPRFDIKGEFGRFIGQLGGFVDEGVAAGEFRRCDTLHAALVCAGCVDVAAGPRLLDAPESSPEEELEGMLSIVLEGLALPEPRS